MKVLSLLVVLVGSASAGVPKPSVTIGLTAGDGSEGNLGGIEPKLNWQTSGEAAGFDFEAGVDVSVSDTTSAPSTSVWGKVKRAIPGFGDISLRGDVDAIDRDIVDLDFRADAFGAALQVVGQADVEGKSGSVKAVQVTTDLDVLGGTVTINPKYDIAGSKGDISLGYSIDDTSVQIDAQKKKLTVSHVLTPNDKITPSVSLDGDFSVSYTRTLEKGKLTTSYSPDDSVKVQWSDGGWDTTFTAPLDGYYKLNSGVKVNMKRNVDML